MVIIGVYGSLKEGFYNHDPYMKGARKIMDTKIFGAMELINGSYPMLFEDGRYPQFDRIHDIEIYEIDDTMFEAIEYMELLSGYKMALMDVEGMDVHVFLAPQGRAFNEKNFIESYSKELFN